MKKHLWLVDKHFSNIRITGQITINAEWPEGNSNCRFKYKQESNKSYTQL